MSLAAISVDFYDDSHRELMTKIAMPPEVRQVNANILTPEELDRLPDHEFGLIMLTKRASVLRKFPVNDPGNAWLSAQYFGHNHEKLAFPARFKAASFIKKACDAYGIPSSNHVEAYAARADEELKESNVYTEGSESKWMLNKLAERELMSKEAAAAQMSAMVNLPDEQFALVIKQPDGEVIRKYAMPDARHVKVAATYFDQYAMDFPPEHRHNFATAVVNRADELGVDVSGSENLEKWASANWNRNIGAHFEQRKSLLPQNKGARETLDKLAAMLNESTPQDVAEALSQFDQANGLTRHYDRHLADPYASVMDKTAEAWSAEVDGRILTKDDLLKEATLKKLSSYLGESFVGQFKNDPVSIFESLPVTERQLVKQVVAGEA